MPIETGPEPLLADNASLIAIQRWCQAPAKCNASGLSPSGFCHLGVTLVGCFNWTAPMAIAAMLTEWVSMGGGPTDRDGPTIRTNMQRFRMRFVTAALGAAMMFVANPTFAQNNEEKPADNENPPAADTKETQKKSDELAEPDRLLEGPAATPECWWPGRRGSRLLRRDDVGTAVRAHGLCG